MRGHSFRKSSDAVTAESASSSPSVDFGSNQERASELVNGDIGYQNDPLAGYEKHPDILGYDLDNGDMGYQNATAAYQASPDVGRGYDRSPGSTATGDIGYQNATSGYDRSPSPHGGYERSPSVGVAATGDAGYQNDPLLAEARSKGYAKGKKIAPYGVPKAIVTSEAFPADRQPRRK